MASNNDSSSVAGVEKAKEHSHTKLPSPRTFRRTLSASSATCGNGGAQGGAPKCVCAPATHAGSFKCRLHRTNSQAHHSSVPMPRGPSSAVDASRTVEAQ